MKNKGQQRDFAGQTDDNAHLTHLRCHAVFSTLWNVSVTCLSLKRDVRE